jgi:tetratricopeptide (TPR) repeat protein
LGLVGAGAAAFVFAVHPVHVEAVANVVGRAEVLAACLTLAAALAYRADGRLAAAGDRRSWRRATASLGTLAATGLGLAAKETAFVIPGVLLLVDWLDGERVGEPARAALRRHGILWAATVALALEWLWLRSQVLGELAGVHPAPGLEGEGLAGRVLVMAPVVLQYLRLLFVPARLSADYSPDFLPAVARVSFTGLVGFLAVAGLVALGVAARRRAPVLTFGLAWIGGSLLIVSNILVPTGVVLAERTLYLASVGAALMLGWLVAWTEASWRRAGVALAGGLVALGMLRTETRVLVWRDNNRFFPQLVQDAPGSYRSYWVAGALAYDAGDRSRGTALLRRAIVVYPYHPRVWETLAYQQEKDGHWLEAARAFRAAFALDSTEAANALLAVRNYLRAGMVDSASILAQRLSRSAPYDPRYYAVMAELDSAQGRPVAMLTWRRRIAWSFPDTWQSWSLMARAALAARVCWDAERSIDRLRALRPDLAEVKELEARWRELRCER